jgi:hypothetical protein
MRQQHAERSSARTSCARPRFACLSNCACSRWSEAASKRRRSRCECCGALIHMLAPSKTSNATTDTIAPAGLLRKAATRVAWAATCATKHRSRSASRNHRDECRTKIGPPSAATVRWQVRLRARPSSNDASKRREYYRWCCKCDRACQRAQRLLLAMLLFPRRECRLALYCVRVAGSSAASANDVAAATSCPRSLRLSRICERRRATNNERNHARCNDRLHGGSDDAPCNQRITLPKCRPTSGAGNSAGDHRGSASAQPQSSLRHRRKPTSPPRPHPLAIARSYIRVRSQRTTR